MCGRYSFSKTNISDLLKRFDLIEAPLSLKANDHIAPTAQVSVIYNDSPKQLSFARWGLVPSWFKEEKMTDGFINARAETILEKPAFKGPVRTKRCLILADSFYEWKKSGNKKGPFRIMLKSGNVFAFAGIWDVRRERGREMRSCAIITTEPNGLIKDIHDRMPVILPAQKEKLWLSDLSLEEISGLLKPYDSDLMQAQDISARTRFSVQNDPQLF